VSVRLISTTGFDSTDHRIKAGKYHNVAMYAARGKGMFSRIHIPAVRMSLHASKTDTKACSAKKAKAAMAVELFSASAADAEGDGDDHITKLRLFIRVTSFGAYFFQVFLYHLVFL